MEASIVFFSPSSALVQRLDRAPRQGDPAFPRRLAFGRSPPPGGNKNQNNSEVQPIGFRFVQLMESELEESLRSCAVLYRTRNLSFNANMGIDRPHKRIGGSDVDKVDGMDQSRTCISLLASLTSWSHLNRPSHQCTRPHRHAVDSPDTHRTSQTASTVTTGFVPRCRPIQDVPSAAGG